MSTKQRSHLVNFNRVMIFALTLTGLLMDGYQHPDLAFTLGLVVWLWLAVFARMEARILGRMSCLSAGVPHHGSRQGPYLRIPGSPVRYTRGLATWVFQSIARHCCLTGHASTHGMNKHLIGGSTARLQRITSLINRVFQSPSVFERSFLFRGAFTKSKLDNSHREPGALTRTDQKDRDYRVPARALVTTKDGVTETNSLHAHAGTVTDARTNAGLPIAKSLVGQRGRIADREIDRSSSADFTDEEIVERMADIRGNPFANSFNLVVGNGSEFPDIRTDRISIAA